MEAVWSSEILIFYHITTASQPRRPQL